MPAACSTASPRSLRPNVDIVIRDNRIEQVVDHRADLHSGRVIDAGSDVVMPGLIEMHAHLSHGLRRSARARIWLSYGITSVRNPAADAYEALEHKESIASRAFAEGRACSPPADPLTDPVSITRAVCPLAGAGQLPQELQKATQLGYDLIKTYVRLDDRLQKQVIDFAHANGLPVTSHEIYPAVASGADGVEHIRGTSRRGYSPKVSALNRSYQDVVDLLTASKMTITPTIGITAGAFPLALARDPSRLDDVRFRTLFPASVVEGMQRQAKSIPAAQFDAMAAAVRPLGDLGQEGGEGRRGGDRRHRLTDFPVRAAVSHRAGDISAERPDAVRSAADRDDARGRSAWRRRAISDRLKRGSSRTW